MALRKSSWREQRVFVPAQARVPVNWKDTSPNVAILANNSNTRVYLSQAANVDETTFDMILPPFGIRVYARPDPIGTLWLYAQADARIHVASLETDFNPMFIPQTQEISAVGAAGLLGVVDVNRILEPLPAGTNEIGAVQIAGFQVPLPQGSNVIGKVDINQWPALPAGNNNIGDVDVVTEPATAAPGQNLPSVVKAIGGMDPSGKLQPLAVTSEGRLGVQSTDLLVQTTSPLAASATYTSPMLAVAGYARLVGGVFADQDGTLYVEQSIDGGTSWDLIDQVAITAGTPARFDIPLVTDTARIRYANGVNAQSAFRLAAFGKVF